MRCVEASRPFPRSRGHDRISSWNDGAVLFRYHGTLQPNVFALHSRLISYRDETAETGMIKNAL
jgi:hypothetical protein